MVRVFSKRPAALTIASTRPFSAVDFDWTRIFSGCNIASTSGISQTRNAFRNTGAAASSVCTSNPPVLLKCGHCISQHAMEKIVRYVESLGVAEVVSDDITVLRLDEVEELPEEDEAGA